MTETKYSEYFKYYISRVEDKPLLNLLNVQLEGVSDLMNNIKTDLLDYKYAENKWTVKEVLFHSIETEIIMLYRAIRISRGDKAALTGYDEDELMLNARVSDMDYNELKDLFIRSRKSTLFYFKHFSKSELAQFGKFSGLELHTEGLGYLIAGHLDHHINVLKERYLE